MALDRLDLDPLTTCCFTGHRVSRLPWGDTEEDLRCVQLKTEMSQSITKAYHQGYRQFLCGMAHGCDFYFCEAVLELSQQLPHMELWAIIPCVTQSQHWAEEDRARYLSLVGRCHQKVTLQAHYTKDCMHRRNRVMVDHSSLLIAAYDGNPVGGALYTILYGMRQKITVETLEIPM